MMDVFYSIESDLDKTLKQNELIKDRLLEATLVEDVKNLVINSCVEIGNKNLQDEIKRFSKESKDVSNESKNDDTFCNDTFDATEAISKRIVDLGKYLSKLEAKSIAFEIALQHKSQENNSLKTLQKENENFLASLQIKNAHLKQTYKDLLVLVQRSRVETNQCDEVKAEKLKSDVSEVVDKKFEHILGKDDSSSSSITESNNSKLEKESGENICKNAKCGLQTKIVELEKVLTQQTKDFDDVKLELSNYTAKFKAYFEKLENMKVVLARQLARKIDESKAEKDQVLKEINHLRTQLENLKGKFVETKFDKPLILGKPPADKLLINS
ncbi:hypothetical protein Tco_0766291 [Tanacetum coccineum]